MQYYSTRGNAVRVSAAETIIRGLAPDGGLFVPAAALPSLTLTQLPSSSYRELANAIFKLFLSDYSEGEIEGAIQKAYNPMAFDHPDIAPLQQIKDREHVLELWHGPTYAFKDIALQVLPHLLKEAIRKLGADDEVVILTATSGDTGKSALEGFRDIEGIKIIVYFPEKGVSEIQKLQMVTQEGSNVSVAAVKGNFDDAQRGVKDIFNDPVLGARLAAKSFRLSSANSINWGRLLPQIVYYFWSYLTLVRQQKIKTGEPVNFVVPTGNFGNILAGFYAKQLGLPVNRLICASNSNKVLTDFIRSGVYNSKRKLLLTLSPSMDILVSSNLERLLFELTERDPEKVTAWMSDLQEKGSYQVDKSILKKLNSIFYAGYADDHETSEAIKHVYDNHGYLVDTHTAVGKKVLSQYLEESGDKHLNILLSTASPFKFAGSVLQALGGVKRIEGLRETELLTALAENTGNRIPENLTGLAEKEIKHKQVITRDAMRNHLLEKLALS